MNVLLVEDSEDDLILLKKAFGRIGISPDTLIWAKNGDEAKRFLSAVPAPILSLIVCDLKMPKVDGFELLEWVKSRREMKGVPFVVLTSSEFEKDTQKAKERGADLYLVKPTRFAELADVVEQLKLLVR